MFKLWCERGISLTILMSSVSARKFYLRAKVAPRLLVLGA